MRTQRNRYPAEFKARVALEAIREQQTINEIASAYGVHPGLVSQWKRELISQLPHIFCQRRDRQDKDHEALTARLYQQIGQLKVELDWLKKKAGLDRS